MNYGAIKTTDIANGPGVRVSLFVSGCRRHCPGCFNQDAQDFRFGTPFGPIARSHILVLCSRDFISGLSILGGEPLEPENLDEVTFLASAFKSFLPEKSVWLYTGNLWEDVKDLPVMQHIDVLVDGEFIEAQKDASLVFRGSRNQRIINVPESLRTGEVVFWEPKL